GIVYLTEDRHDGMIYRFIPHVPGKLHEGGKLQALVIQDQPSLDTRNWEEPLMEEGQSWPVSWLTLDKIESPKDDLRLRGFKAGAARFARGEGIWMGEGELYFACTNGGPDKFGQIFRYTLSPKEGTSHEMKRPGQLELFMESRDKTVLHMCDNLTIAPNGDLFVCEDNGRLNRIHHISQEGHITPFAVNRGSDSEFAGVVFSPSGKTLFVNIQENGETIAITGPWENIFVS
ncbi:MAG: alkaline phosphatase PhoX, partial [Bacteroidota bacterium]